MVGLTVTVHLSCTRGADRSPQVEVCYEHWSLHGLAAISVCSTTCCSLSASDLADSSSQIPADIDTANCFISSTISLVMAIVLGV